MAEEGTYQVLYDYSDVPTLKKFALCNDRVRCVIGPFGCLRGDTLVITEEGLLQISEIDHPMRVLSWDEKSNQFVFSLSGGALPKGKDYLYRIVTRFGEWTAAGHHRVLDAFGKYRQVSDLAQGDYVGICSYDHLQKLLLEIPKVSREDGLRSSEKFSSWQVRCAKLIRQYGQQLLWSANTSLSVSPSSTDVPVLPSSPYSVFYEQKDDDRERLLGRNHQSQSYDLIHTGGYPPRVVPHGEAGAIYTFLQSCQHIFSRLQRFPLSLYRTLRHHTKKLFSEYFHSYKSSSLSDATIISIERLKVKEVFWDMQVDDTHNYVTVDGAIHHNSGKSSAMVMELIRLSHQQKPSPDGIRRTRWAVVRNTFGQLKDTTIKTFHDWFPPKLFGEYRVTDHVYLITKFPGVHIEVMFRALDRPDQVSNLLSLELTGAWFNEVREIPKTIVEAMEGRIGRYPSARDGGASWYGMIMDTNAPDNDSWIYHTFERVKPEGWSIYKQPSGLSVHAENTKYLPEGYYKKLAQGKDEQYIRVYIHGQYGYQVSGKPVFSSFNDTIHVSRKVLEPIKGLDVILGFDFGLQPACLIAQITPLGQLRILDELVSDGMGLRQFCQNQLLPLLQRKYFGMNVMGFGDPSGTSRAPTDESTCFEVLQGPEIGLRNIIPAPTNAILPRIGAVESFLNKMYAGEPGFILSPNCNFARKALNGGYHYAKDPKARNEEYKPMPEKNFSSHIMDALQYLCMYIDEKAENDKKWRAFTANLKRRNYHPASSVTGY